MPSIAETFSIRLPEELKNEVEALAKLSRRSRSFIIKEAVALYVEDQREYLKAIDEAMAEADKGVFVSGERAFEWLDSLARGVKAPLPDPDILSRKSE